MKIKFETLLILVGLAVSGVACGVKGPPLPPLPDTPENSDQEVPVKKNDGKTKTKKQTS